MCNFNFVLLNKSNFLNNAVVSTDYFHTPTKGSNAQHMVEYEKQLLYEEYQKSGNVMQQPMDPKVYGLNLRTESSLVLSDLLLA